MPGLFSPQGVQGRLQVGPDGNLITGTLAPNVGAFGWTANDMKSVTDLVQWVSQAINAATSAQANADYTGKVVTFVNTAEGEITNKVADATTAVTNAQKLLTDTKADVATMINDAKLALADVKHYHDAAFTAMDFIVVLYDALAQQFPQLPAKPVKPVPFVPTNP